MHLLFRKSDIVCLDLDQSIRYKEKKALIDLIAKHGVKVSFILNGKCSYLIRNNRENLDTYKCRAALKLGIKILDSNLLQSCLLKDDDAIGRLDQCLIEVKSQNKSIQHGIIQSNGDKLAKKKIAKLDLGKVKYYEFGNDPFEIFFKDFDLIKWQIIKDLKTSNSIVLELQKSKLVDMDSDSMTFRIRYESNNPSALKFTYSNSGASIHNIYQAILRSFTNDKLYELSKILTDSFGGSKLLQSVSLLKYEILLIEQKFNN